MTHRDMINKIFRNFYDSNYLPSAYGGFETSNYMQLIQAFISMFEEKKKDLDISRVWYDGNTVTWYTKDLHLLLSIPRFADDSDQTFLDRVITFQAAQRTGGQSADSIRTVVAGLLSEAVVIANISIITKSETVSRWSDSIAVETWDGSITWSGLDEQLDVHFLVQIHFPLSGFDTDKYSYEYWQLSENYTKIQELIRLFKPVGKNFKIELIPPLSRKRYWTSNSRIKFPDSELTILSSTRILYSNNEVLKTSDLRIKTLNVEKTQTSNTKIA